MTEISASGWLPERGFTDYDIPPYAIQRRRALQDGTIIWETISTRIRDMFPAFTASRGSIRFFRPPPFTVIQGELQMKRAWRSWAFWLFGRR